MQKKQSKLYFRGTSRPQVFPFRESNGDTDEGDKKRQGQLSSTITAKYAGRNGRGTHIEQLNQPIHSNNRVYGPNGLSPTLNTAQGGNRQPFIAVTERRTGEVRKIRRETKDRDCSPRRGTYLDKRNDDIGNCVTAGQGKECYVTNDTQIRRLTPTECMRLQSFPDDWCDVGVTFTTPVVYDKGYANAKKKNTIKILRILQETVGENLRKGWGFTELVTFLKKEVLQPQMYARVIQRKVEERCSTSTGELQSTAVDYCNRMYFLWLKQKSRYTSQRQEQIEQLFGKLRSSLSQLPHQITPQGGWLESTKKAQGKEWQICFTWLSDSQKYKLVGNAITVKVVKAIIEKLLP
jgi:site-specific DNA-cytosine methylase